MKHTVRENICVPYSLHDMSIPACTADGADLTLYTQSGLKQAAPPYGQPDGHVVFHRVQWDFSYVYLLEHTGNIGPFAGRKLFLRDFIRDHPTPYLTVMDETYGYNMTKYSGYLTINHRHWECILEICHEGDMVFVTEE